MFARTPRLLLRPGWMEDAPMLARTIGDPSVLRNLTRAPSPYGLDDAEAFLALPQHPLAWGSAVFGWGGTQLMALRQLRQSRK